MNVYAYVYKYIRKHIYIFSYIHTYIYICIYISIYVYIYMYIRPVITEVRHAIIYMYIYVYMCTHVSVYLCVCICIFIHIHYHFFMLSRPQAHLQKFSLPRPYEVLSNYISILGFFFGFHCVWSFQAHILNSTDSDYSRFWSIWYFGTVYFLLSFFSAFLLSFFSSMTPLKT